jgi:hypothetical protein
MKMAAKSGRHLRHRLPKPAPNPGMERSLADLRKDFKKELS